MITTTDIVSAIKAADFNKPSIRKAIEPFIGQPHDGEKTRIHYGSIPTDQLHIETDDEGTITKIRWWSGLKWSARGGYGTPSVEVS